ncbi:MAG: hypothetical protein PVJ57_04010 [Phycisphaerae bacterium]|jgi:hypothetical protein
MKTRIGPGYLKDDRPAGDEDNWTPLGGVVRAAIVGTVVALVLAALTAPIVWYVPPIIMHWAVRSGLAFVLAWVLFGVTQKTAGFVGWPVSGLAILLVVAVLLSHHVVIALHIWQASALAGPPTGLMYSNWLSLPYILLLNATAFVTLGMCTWMFHSGDNGGFAALTEFFTLPVRGSRR